MKPKKFNIFISNFNFMEVFISDGDKSNFILTTGDHYGWKWISFIPSKEKKKTFRINENVFNYILKINPHTLYYINSSKTIYELFEKWGLYDMIGEELI